MKYPVGSQHTAKVRNFTNFGVFVELEEGVDGLIHISDLSWTKKIKHPNESRKSVLLWRSSSSKSTRKTVVSLSATSSLKRTPGTPSKLTTA